MTTNVNSPVQFKLFMTGTEWQAAITHSSDGPIEHVWQQKENESKAPASAGTHGAGVYDSIKEHGFDLSRGAAPNFILDETPNGKDLKFVQGEGHHRVAAAAAIERETGKPVYLPVNYIDNTSAGRRARRPK